MPEPLLDFGDVGVVIEGIGTLRWRVVRGRRTLSPGLKRSACPV
jgi:hypothetical protein